MQPTPSDAPVEAPPPPVLITPALTHALEVDLVSAANKMIERLVDDKRQPFTVDARRQLERAAKMKVAEILKRAAVTASDAINGVVVKSGP
jgi:hypothetical protein